MKQTSMFCGGFGGLPYNPVLEERLEVGDWDYYNATVSKFEESGSHVGFDVDLKIR